MEFALIAPVLIALLFGILALSLGFLTRNALQEAAQEAARCAAIGSTACGSVTTGCDSSNATICYVEAVAANRGVSNVKASQVAVSTTASYGGASFTTVTITYPYALMGFSFDIVVVGSFPNSS